MRKFLDLFSIYLIVDANILFINDLNTNVNQYGLYLGEALKIMLQSGWK